MMVQKIQNQNNQTETTNNLKDCHLSIQLSLDGFSFSVLNPSTKEIGLTKFLPFKEPTATPELHLKNFKQQLEQEKVLQNTFASVNVSHVNDLCTLVPRPLFDAQNLKQYIKYNTKIYKNDYIVYDEIDNQDMVNVYLPFVNLNNYLFDKYGSFEYKHAGSIYVSHLLQTYRYSEHPKMFVHLYKHCLEMVIISKNQLQFHNFFNYQTKEDLIYYILFTAEQLHLNPELFEVHLSGEIKEKDSFFNMVYTYVRHVKMLEIRSNYKFNQAFNTQDKHRFFTLINQF